ncbi:hypothetical protein LIER_12832 [Lithospermum erythrorhizon]|uniref:Reverse transcriptase zinc-binding domain-containing protein n=1 Tax=Lithospermum erythrorhizon TaxID=34254 RepID=A0AAV3PUN2_LITER
MAADGDAASCGAARRKLDVIEGREVVRYCSNDVLRGVNRWSSVAFGFVLGLNLNFGVVESFFEKSLEAISNQDHGSVTELVVVGHVVGSPSVHQAQMEVGNSFEVLVEVEPLDKDAMLTVEDTKGVRTYNARSPELSSPVGEEHCWGSIGLLLVMIVSNALKEFGEFSGLKPNLGKSTVYVAGLEQEQAVQISQMVGISLGKLPVKYLGIPLITKPLGREPLKSRDSSIWRQLLKSREVVRHHIAVQVVDGRRARFWHDKWHPRGVLVDVVSVETKKSLRIAENATIEEVVWFKGSISRCSFVCWVLFHDKLPTKDRLKKWGL